MATIRNLCTRCIVLDKGRLIYDGDVETAIAKYMESAETGLSNKFDFSNMERTAEGYASRFKLKSLEFIDRELPIYKNVEKMRFRIEWEGIKTIDDVRMRLEIKYADGTTVGMAESKVFASIREKETGSNLFEFDLKNLATGNYHFRVSFFVLNSMGVHTGLDDAPIKISFSVIDSLEDHTRWLRQYWGSVRFDDIVVVD